MDSWIKSWGSKEKCTILRWSARNRIKKEQNWRSNGVGFEFGGGRERERIWIFWVGYLFPACLWHPIHGTGAWYGRIPPIPGAAALGLRQSTRYGRTVWSYPPVPMVTKPSVSLPKFGVSSSKWYGRTVRSGLPVPMIAKVIDDFGETSSFLPRGCGCGTGTWYGQLRPYRRSQKSLKPANSKIPVQFSCALVHQHYLEND